MKLNVVTLALVGILASAMLLPVLYDWVIIPGIINLVHSIHTVVKSVINTMIDTGTAAVYDITATKVLLTGYEWTIMPGIIKIGSVVSEVYYHRAVHWCITNAVQAGYNNTVAAIIGTRHFFIRAVGSASNVVTHVVYDIGSALRQGYDWIVSGIIVNLLQSFIIQPVQLAYIGLYNTSTIVVDFVVEMAPVVFVIAVYGYLIAAYMDRPRPTPPPPPPKRSSRPSKKGKNNNNNKATGAGGSEATGSGNSGNNKTNILRTFHNPSSVAAPVVASSAPAVPAQPVIPPPPTRARPFRPAYHPGNVPQPTKPKRVKKVRKVHSYYGPDYNKRSAVVTGTCHSRHLGNIVSTASEIDVPFVAGEVVDVVKGTYKGDRKAVVLKETKCMVYVQLSTGGQPVRIMKTSVCRY